jgi:hypothetical protein
MPNSFGIPSPIGLATNQQQLAASGGAGDCSRTPPQPDSQACGSPTARSEVVGGNMDMRCKSEVPAVLLLKQMQKKD